MVVRLTRCHHTKRMAFQGPVQQNDDGVSEKACWEIIPLRSSPAQMVGYVVADEKTVLKMAIEQFHIRKADQRRLPVRRA